MVYGTTVATKPARKAHSKGSWTPSDPELSPRTRTAYADQWRWFVQWCEQHGKRDMPAKPEVLAAYLQAQADRGWKVSSLGQALAAVARAHDDAEQRSPRHDPKVLDTWRQIRKRQAPNPSRKAALSTDWLRAMVEASPEDARGARDRALLLVGFAGGFRRSELVALQVEDLHFHEEGLEIVVAPSGGESSEGAATVKLITPGQNPTTCPVRALEEWLDQGGITEGPVFRPIDQHGNIRSRALTPHSISNLIKQSARRAGLDAAQLSGHSLRAGFIGTALLAGASEAAVMEQTGHRSTAGLRRYAQRPGVSKKPASSDLGL